MEIQKAINRLEKIGAKIYPRGEGFSVWMPWQKNNFEEFRYSSRGLVKLAKGFFFARKIDRRFMSEKRKRIERRFAKEAVRELENDFFEINENDLLEDY